MVHRNCSPRQDSGYELTMQAAEILQIWSSVGDEPNFTVLCQQLRTVVQVGFYCGQSAVVFLEANPKVKIIGFDDFSYAAGEACYNHLQHKYPGRINVYRGLSQDTIPAFIAEHSKVDGVYRGPVCDLIRTDARPEYTLRRQDFAELQPMTSCSTLVLFNDVCDIQNCHLYQVRTRVPLLYQDLRVLR